MAAGIEGLLEVTCHFGNTQSTEAQVIEEDAYAVVRDGCAPVIILALAHAGTATAALNKSQTVMVILD